jgi:hypothetical protein
MTRKYLLSAPLQASRRARRSWTRRLLFPTFPSQDQALDFHFENRTLLASPMATMRLEFHRGLLRQITCRMRQTAAAGCLPASPLGGTCSGPDHHGRRLLRPTCLADPMKPPGGLTSRRFLHLTNARTDLPAEKAAPSFLPGGPMPKRRQTSRRRRATHGSLENRSVNRYTLPTNRRTTTMTIPRKGRFPRPPTFPTRRRPTEGRRGLGRGRTKSIQSTKPSFSQCAEKSSARLATSPGRGTSGPASN